MSKQLELIPDNDLFKDASMFDRNSVLHSVSVTPAQVQRATRYLGKHAPDLAAMILGNVA